MGMWQQEDRVYTLRLATGEITHKSIHLIPGRWNHGCRIIVQIIDNDPSIEGYKRKVYDQWFYDHGGETNIPQMSLQLSALGSGEVCGRTAEYMVYEIFNHIFATFADVRQEIIKHFPKTAMAMVTKNMEGKS